MFSLFENVGAQYFDVTGILGLKRANEERLNAIALAAALKETAFRGRRPPFGPIVLLADEAQVQFAFIEQLSAQLDDLAEGGWEVMRIPEADLRRGNDGRAIIFISHATPNDNDFAHWLGTQLQLAGYQVWIDLERLVAGEVFWDNIEETIRNKAAKVVVAATRLAQSRNGVLDEINLAVSVERTLGLENFVIPLKLDDLPYDQFRANLARKNILDFSENWAQGLSMLLKALQRDRVPRASHDSIGELARTIHSRISDEPTVLQEPETLLLNWIEIQSLPPSMNIYSLTAPSNKLSTISKVLLLPHVRYGDSIISFASPDVMEENLPFGVSARRKASLLTSEFLKGRPPEIPALHRNEARKILSNLIRQGWDAKARLSGCHAYELASAATAWFAPDGLISNNNITFIDAGGQRRRKSLVGFSAKRKAYWHFALEMRLAPGQPLRLLARPHVVFSEDGKMPLNSPNRMHALRRGFCKTWWNDRWRDLSIAYLSWFGGDAEAIEVSMGCTEPMVISSRFMNAICPVTPNSMTSVSSTENEHQNDSDDSDDVDLDDEEVAQLERIHPGTTMLPEQEA